MPTHPVPFVCPTCGSALATAPAHCGGCDITYPSVGGIPLVLSEPETTLSHWAARLADFIEETAGATRHLAIQLVEESLLERSRARLNNVLECLPRHQDAIVQLFADAGIAPSRASDTNASDLPSPQIPSLLSYYTLIHRDWSWAPEVDEVTPSVDAIKALLPEDFELGNTLVLGAGTARLAWELGNQLKGAKDIIALDINPLPFLVTQRLMVGQTVKLFELPGHPRRSEVAAARRTLKAESPPPPGLRLVFADGLKPPFAASTFDTIITPWFVDQVPANAASLPPMISALLREGGTWLNHGPFVYAADHTLAAHRYCADEFLQLVARGGFKVPSAKYEAVPYLASPVSTQGRTEHVLSMFAQKVASHRQARPEPAWLLALGSTLVVPRMKGLINFQAPHPTVGAVAALIDGQHNVRQMARSLVEEGILADDDTAETAVRGCLKIVWKALKDD